MHAGGSSSSKEELRLAVRTPWFKGLLETAVLVCFRLLEASGDEMFDGFAPLDASDGLFEELDSFTPLDASGDGLLASLTPLDASGDELFEELASFTPLDASGDE